MSLFDRPTSFLRHGALVTRSDNLNRMGTGNKVKSYGLTGLAQRRTQDPKGRGSNPARSTRKMEFLRVKIMLCRLAVSVPNPCVYIYTRTRIMTYARSRSCSPCQSSVDYENTKRPSMNGKTIAELRFAPRGCNCVDVSV